MNLTPASWVRLSRKLRLPLLYGGTQRVVRDDGRVRELAPRDRRRLVPLEPSSDRVVLVGVAIGSDMRILHQLLTSGKNSFLIPHKLNEEKES